MNKKNFMSVTLLVSAFAFNPLIAQQLQITVNTQFKFSSVTSSIASILHKRGLDENVAEKISKNLVKEENEHFAMMIENVLNQYNNITKDEILEYLSRAALHREDVHLDTYAQLVHMISTIQQKSLDKDTLAQLNMIAKQNASLLG